jgi:hypothetical protein
MGLLHRQRSGLPAGARSRLAALGARKAPAPGLGVHAVHSGWAGAGGNLWRRACTVTPNGEMARQVRY